MIFPRNPSAEQNFRPSINFIDNIGGAGVMRLALAGELQEDIYTDNVD